MKIATFNIDWARKNSAAKTKIENLLLTVDADIIVINEAIELDLISDYQVLKSIQLPDAIFEEVDYRVLLKNKVGYRTIVYSKYPVIRTFEISDSFTAIAAELSTEFGLLTIYGTIVGTRFLSNKYSEKELSNVVTDCEKLLLVSNHFVLVGDLNTAFLDGEEDYQIKGLKTRNVLLEFFKKNSLVNTTESIPLNIDHVVVNRSLMEVSTAKESIFVDKGEVSDHKGVLVKFERKNFS